ncbi:Uma2 family endonuclease [Tigheibacillus jepli]|uniref:Uma2 family endonuclease n=1 Tax=Tigheibacillus jepli TaxID=3035914 RepID=UPI00387E10FE
MDKRLAHQRVSVKEYWIVDPANQIVEVHLLKGRYLELSNVYSKEDSLPVNTLDGFSIDLSLIFKNPCTS